MPLRALGAAGRLHKENSQQNVNSLSPLLCAKSKFSFIFLCIAQNILKELFNVLPS